MRSYALAMAATCVVAVGTAAGVAALLGGGGTTTTLAAAAVGIASLATFAPVLLAFRVTAQNFGLMVLGASMVRMLMLLGIGLGFDSTRDIARMPFWIGLILGGGLVLAVESALAIGILSKNERLKSLSQRPSGR
jgi:hypothetical protein